MGFLPEGSKNAPQLTGQSLLAINSAQAILYIIYHDPAVKARKGKTSEKAQAFSDVLVHQEMVKGSSATDLLLK